MLHILLRPNTKLLNFLLISEVVKILDSAKLKISSTTQCMKLDSFKDWGGGRGRGLSLDTVTGE